MQKRYSSDLSWTQYVTFISSIVGYKPRLRKHDLGDIIDAIAYVMKTGCQWRQLPKDMPPWRTVYNHFRSWGDRGVFRKMLPLLVQGKRGREGQPPVPNVVVIDSQSVRSAYAQSQKGVDGNKKVKGIKRHIAVDDNGWPVAIHVTRANENDSNSAIPLMRSALPYVEDHCWIKADLGYRGNFSRWVTDDPKLILECVKSNYGTEAFKPIDGRWVVERTFSWMENSRRLTRNYERWLSTALHAQYAASVFFMLRYF